MPGWNLSRRNLSFPGPCPVASHCAHEGAIRPISNLDIVCRPFQLVVLDSLWYTGTMVHDKRHLVERVQTGVRMEKRLLKVLKGIAEDRDMTLGDLLEGIVLHAFDGKCPFRAETLSRIRELKKFYRLDLDSTASHKLVEASGPRAGRKEKRR